MAAKFCQVVGEYISKGYACKLTPEQAKSGRNDITWYLPHHPVLIPNKPGKLRIVFNAVAEYKGTSLNKNLIQGPDMKSSLFGALLRFRQGNVGLAADVEAVFHQVCVQEQDQDALHFLWLTDSFDDPPDVYVMEVHIFGDMSSPCVANSVLRKTATDDVQRFNRETAAIVAKNFYDDDALPSFSDEKSASSAVSDVAEMLSRVGFRLTKFTSNSKSVLSTVPPKERSTPDLNLDSDEMPV